MKYTPLHDLVIVKIKPCDPVTKTGIITGKQEKPTTGTVYAAGPDAEGLSVDDRVVFLNIAEREDKLGDETLLWLRYSNVIGIIK